MKAEAIRRIRSAIKAMELRRESVVSCIGNRGESFTVFFRSEEFHVPISIENGLRDKLTAIQCLNNGFLGFTEDPSGLRELLETGADSIKPHQEDWADWAEELGMKNPRYADVLQILALNAVWFQAS
jgi:hypothetical protein